MGKGNGCRAYSADILRRGYFLMFKKVLIAFAVSVFTGAFLIGCDTVPDGYGREFPIIYYSSFDDIAIEAAYYIGSQFHYEPVHNENTSDKKFFIYKEEKYYVKTKVTGDWYFNNYYTVIKDNDEESEEIIGDFTEVQKEHEKVKWYCGITFLDEHYLYYCYRKTFEKERFFPSPDGLT